MESELYKNKYFKYKKKYLELHKIMYGGTGTHNTDPYYISPVWTKDIQKQKKYQFINVILTNFYERHKENYTKSKDKIIFWGFSGTIYNIASVLGIKIDQSLQLNRNNVDFIKHVEFIKYIENILGNIRNKIISNISDDDVYTYIYESVNSICEKYVL